MRYKPFLLEHFHHPKNVGKFELHEDQVGAAYSGSYENGAIIHFQVKVTDGIIIAAKFKAFGPCVLIAACSFAAEWITHKTLEEASQLTSSELVRRLDIPSVKMHSALLVEDTVKSAIKDYALKWLS